MSLDEQTGDGRANPSKLFWWPCPMCRLWHQTRLAVELLDGDHVDVRCPLSGRTVERPVPHPSGHAGSLAPAIRPGFFRRLFGRSPR